MTALLFLLFVSFLLFFGSTNAAISFVLRKTPQTLSQVDPGSPGDSLDWLNQAGGACDPSVAFAATNDGLYCYAKFLNNGVSGGNTRLWSRTMRLTNVNAGIGAGATIGGIQLDIVKYSEFWQPLFNADHAALYQPQVFDETVYLYKDGAAYTKSTFEAASAYQLQGSEGKADRSPFPINASLLYPYEEGGSFWGDTVAAYPISHLNSVNFGCEYSATYTRATPADSQNDRVAIIDDVKLVIYSSGAWTVGSLNPTEDWSTLINNPVQVAGTGFGASNPGAGYIRCKFAFSTGEVLINDGTWNSDIQVTCLVPTNFGAIGTTEISVSINQGADFVGSATYTYLVLCPDNCTDMPTRGSCNNTDATCSCNSGYYGNKCEKACSDAVDNGCPACSVLDPSQCGFCIDTMTCGPCGGENVLGANCSVIVSVEEFIDPTSTADIVFSANYYTDQPSECTYIGKGHNYTVTVNGTDPTTRTISCQHPPISEFTELTEPGDFVTWSVNFTRLGVPLQDVPTSVVFGYASEGGSAGGGSHKIVGQEKAGEVAGYTAAGIVGAGLLIAFGAWRWKIYNDKFKSLKGCPMFSIASAFRKDYYIGSSTSEISDNESTVWYLIELFEAKNWLLLDAFGDEMDSLESTPSTDDIISAFVYVMEQNGLVHPSIAHVLERHIKAYKKKSSTDLAGVGVFREVSIATKMWTSYVKMDFGLRYIWQTLGSPLYNICSKFGLEGLDIKGNNEDDELTNSAQQNQYLLLASCQEIFEAIKQSVEFVPPHIQSLMAKIRTIANTEIEDSYYQIAGGFLFLRLWCPALAAPMEYGLLTIDPPDEAQQLLVDISKTINRLATGSTFRDPRYASLNEFLTSNARPYHEHLDCIAEYDEDGDEPSVQAMTADITHTSYALIRNFIFEHQSTLSQRYKDLGADNNDINNFQQVIDVFGSPLDLSTPEDDDSDHDL